MLLGRGHAIQSLSTREREREISYNETKMSAKHLGVTYLLVDKST